MNFIYERMGSFCFVCGIVGHTERECSVVYANPDKEIERAYGTWLRAPGRGRRQNACARWLRTPVAAGRSTVVVRCKRRERMSGKRN